MTLKHKGCTVLLICLILTFVGSVSTADTGSTHDMGAHFISIGYRPAQIADFVLPEKSAEKEGEAQGYPSTFIRGNANLVYRIDGETGEIELQSGLSESLTDLQIEAIEIAPAWLRDALIDRFFELGADAGDEFADLILNPDDPRYTDELAFLVAMTGKRDLDNAAMAQLLQENVALIHQYDTWLEYVELVDTGEPGDEDYGTTARYQVKIDDNLETFEIPREIYYWYIVHPKLDQEDIAYVAPSTGHNAKPDQGGKFWRYYLMYDEQGEDSYTMPYFLRHPNVITEAQLQGWNPTSTAVFAARDVYNIDAVLDPNGDPVLVEISHPNVNGKGTAVYTTLNLADTCDAGYCDLLDNLLAYGAGDMEMRDGAKVLIMIDDNKVGIDGFISGRLAMLGYTDVTVIGATDFLALTRTDLDAYTKILVPDGLSHDTYEAVSLDPDPDNPPQIGHPDLDGWLNDGYRILQIHAATGQDLTDLTFIGGYQLSTPVENSTVTIAGRPLLADVIAQADYLWDGEVYGGLTGNRNFDEDGGMALRIIGNWIGKNMMDRVAEYVEKWSLLSVERAIEPVRIVWNHFGNCGELQDMWSAALRTCLIPGLNVSNSNEDHVWNEFYHDGNWYYLQDDWSNGATRIATPGGSQDTDFGGGKTTSFVIGWDGNGEIYSVSERYSETIDLTVHLTDAAGNGVPGARVWLGSEGYYGGGNNWSLFLFTDEDGYAATKIGDGRNYYIRVDSGAGYWPDDDTNHAFQIIEAEDATPGQSFLVEHEMPEVLPGEMKPAEAEDAGGHGLHLQFDTFHRFMRQSHAFNGVIFSRPYENRGLDVYLMDKDNLNSCMLGKEEFEAAASYTARKNFDQEIFAPADGKDWYVVVANTANPQSTITLDIDAQQVTGEEPEDGDDEDSGGSGDDEDDDSGCCGC